MTRKDFIAASAALALAFAALGEETGPAETAETAERVELREGETFPIEALKLTRSTLYDVVVAEKRILLRVTPDGFMQFVDTAARVKVFVQGKRRNNVSFELQEGELASVWPVVTVELFLTDTDAIAVNAASADWAFVVRAEEVRKGGLPAVADGDAVTLLKGQRLDADMREGKVVFLVTAQTWPGRPVAMPAVAEHVREPRAPTVVVVAKPALPGVLIDRERDFPWQTIPLPVIAFKVFFPPNVSP